MANFTTMSGAALCKEGRVGAVPGAADLGLRAGDLALGEVDVEGVPAEGALPVALRGAATGLQRADQGDLMGSRAGRSSRTDRTSEV